nr:uncharacterized protein LOC127295095 isoform X2 [Lolium perenne]XP_051180965.1 uncharacterized protein LOC127295095 isoform X3 [Lolium perenne]
MMTPQEQAEMRAYFAELDAREAQMTPKEKAECNAYFKHLESKSDTPHESSEDVSISNNLTSTPLVLSSSLLGCSDIDDAIAMEMRDSTICEMSDSTICEMSDSTVCELDECLHFESMSDTPCEMRVVVDRSCEAISNSNNLPSTSSVFPRVSLGSMDDETPIMEKMYMVHEDDDITPCLLLEDEHGGHVEPTSSTTPTSYERDYKGTYMGVDDAMIPLVDMMICECLHELDDPIAMSYASFLFPCDALLDNIVDHVELVAYDNMSMPCYESFPFSPIACNLSNNFSFPCVDCNKDIDACVVTTLPNNCSFPRFVDNNDETLNMFCSQCLQYSPINASKILNTCSFKCLVCNYVNVLVSEIAPIALSNFGDFAYIHVDHVPMFTPHIHHIYYDALLNANGDVQKRWTIMMDDVFIYHAHTLFLLSNMCVGTQTPMSTSIEHELTKRALESMIQVSSNEWFCPHTSTTQDLSMRAHRHFDKGS